MKLNQSLFDQNNLHPFEKKYYFNNDYLRNKEEFSLVEHRHIQAQMYAGNTNVARHRRMQAIDCRIKLMEKKFARDRNNFLHRNRRLRDMPYGYKQQALISEDNWYRISIPFGCKYKKDYVIKSLLSYMAPETFVPIMYRITRYDANFYVDEYKTAETLLNCDRKITMVDGLILQVRGRPGFPPYEINNKYKERLKQVISKRYVQETNTLDLSKFHQDPGFIDDYYCALNRSLILKTVLDIIGEYAPTLETLNLESNKLYNFNELNELNKKFSKLKILYIGNNAIKSIHQLDAIKDFKLEELKLAGNPICDKYKSQQNNYICDIRKLFPKLLRLDDMELPPPIVFDVIDVAKIPQSQRIIFTDAKAQHIASQFFQQYYTILDGEERQFLLNAYDNEAYFSMTITSSHTTLNEYFTNNRNLFKIYDTVKRQKLLKYGRLPIVTFISEMPRTKHLLDTFTMDIALATQTMMFITITGYFQELDNKKQPIRHFNRTFIIVPEGDGYCIRNEQLQISQPSETQLKQLSQQIQPKTLEVLPAETVKPTTLKLSEDIKQQMTVTLSQQTNMNLEWSSKCLQEMQWNYNNALCAFQEFFKRGQIPSEAFKKCT